MARKTSLRDFQEYLATRLSQAAKGKGDLQKAINGPATWVVSESK